MFKLFQGVQVVTIQTAEFTKEIVINLNDILRKIVRYFSAKAMMIYDVSGNEMVDLKNC